MVVCLVAIVKISSSCFSRVNLLGVNVDRGFRAMIVVSAENTSGSVNRQSVSVSSSDSEKVVVTVAASGLVKFGDDVCG